LKELDGQDAWVVGEVVESTNGKRNAYIVDEPTIIHV